MFPGLQGWINKVLLPCGVSYSLWLEWYIQ